MRVHGVEAERVCSHDHAGARALEERGVFCDSADSESFASSANFGEPDSPAFLAKMENSRIKRIYGDMVKVVIPQVAEHSHKVEARRDVEQRQNELWQSYCRAWLDPRKSRKRAAQILAAASATGTPRTLTPEDSESECSELSDWLQQNQMVYVREDRAMTTASECTVYVIKAESGHFLALKQIRPNHANEARNLQFCTGMAHIIQLAWTGDELGKCGIVTVQSRELAVVLQFREGITVREAVTSADWLLVQCQICAVELVRAVEVLHDRGLVHGYIHCGGILVHNAQTTVTLVDMSHSVVGDEPLESAGKRGWWAPEACENAKEDHVFLRKEDRMQWVGEAKENARARRCGKASLALDVWAVGVTVCCMGASNVGIGERQNETMADFARAQGEKRQTPSDTRRLIRDKMFWLSRVTSPDQLVLPRDNPVWTIVQRALILSPLGRPKVRDLLV
jgi:serine/threonine protein kinase